jgi:hypothetical protein
VGSDPLGLTPHDGELRSARGAEGGAHRAPLETDGRMRRGQLLRPPDPTRGFDLCERRPSLRPCPVARLLGGSLEAPSRLSHSNSRFPRRSLLTELAGLEPATSWARSMRSTATKWRCCRSFPFRERSPADPEHRVMGWLDAHSSVGISLTRTHRRLVELPADLTCGRTARVVERRGAASRRSKSVPKGLRRGSSSRGVDSKAALKQGF